MKQRWHGVESNVWIMYVSMASCHCASRNGCCLSQIHSHILRVSLIDPQRPISKVWFNSSKLSPLLSFDRSPGRMCILRKTSTDQFEITKGKWSRHWYHVALLCHGHRIWMAMVRSKRFGKIVIYHWSQRSSTYWLCWGSDWFCEKGKCLYRSTLSRTKRMHLHY